MLELLIISINSRPNHAVNNDEMASYTMCGHLLSKNEFNQLQIFGRFFMVVFALLVAPLWPSSVTAFEGPNGIALLVAPLWPSSVTAFEGPMVLLFWWRLCGPSSVTAFGGPMVLLFWWRLCGPHR
uniref:Uncharacterized protein n=1 Tax=Meloidogyne enterolobii TaxID=390850 RepID=A0A6V7UYX2_MELEN|nr:unnamed protein product [Meloidogyne enterolobii]